MLVTIYFKYAGSQGHPYLFSDEEYRRFQQDFESFLKQRSPLGGTYHCKECRGSGPIPRAVDLIIGFHSIGFIESTASLASTQIRTEQITTAQQRASEQIN